MLDRVSLLFKRIEKSGEGSHSYFSKAACHRVPLFS